MFSKLSKIFSILIFAFSAAALLSFDANAQVPQILDTRCVRENLLNPDSCYVTGFRRDENGNRLSGRYEQGCQEDGNKESYIVGLVEHCNESEFEADFILDADVIDTDKRLSPESLPILIRTLITLALAALSITLFVVVIFGYFRWMSVSFNSEDTKSAFQFFRNALWGLIFTMAAIPIVSVVFFVLGYRDNPFQIDETLDLLFEIDCEAISTTNYCLDPTDSACRDDVIQICNKYDLSCTTSGTGGLIQCIKQDNET